MHKKYRPEEGAVKTHFLRNLRNYSTGLPQGGALCKMKGPVGTRGGISAILEATARRKVGMARIKDAEDAPPGLVGSWKDQPDLRPGASPFNTTDGRENK